MCVDHMLLEVSWLCNDDGTTPIWYDTTTHMYKYLSESKKTIKREEHDDIAIDKMNELWWREGSVGHTLNGKCLTYLWYIC